MKIVFRCDVRMAEKRYDGFTFKRGVPYRAFKTEDGNLIALTDYGEIFVPSDEEGKIFSIFL